METMKPISILSLLSSLSLLLIISLLSSLAKIGLADAGFWFTPSIHDGGHESKPICRKDTKPTHSPSHRQGLAKNGLADRGFGSAPSIYDGDHESKSIYWEVTNPTLSPSHLQGLAKNGLADGRFGSAPSVYDGDHESKSIYWKVTNPTLSPSHLQDLPGFTRSVYKQDHALITPESHVFTPLPDWANTSGAYLITPAIGSHFVMYLVQMQGKSRSGLPPANVERFIFVVQGSVSLLIKSGASHKLKVDSYAYLPPDFDHSVKCKTSATLVVFERRYTSLDNLFTEFIVGSTDKQPLVETPKEVFKLRKLLPPSLNYDFNIHIMDFQPGEFLNVKEVHYNQHGLLMLEGQGIYRLGDSWYPVQAGDVIWMAPFVPQWYAALGKTRSRYLLYKDVNRNPLY